MTALPRRILCLVTDRSLRGGVDGLIEAVEAAVAGGVNLVQLREKDLPTEDLMALVKRLRHVTAGRALLVLNGSADVARMAGADGVHIAESAAGRSRDGGLLTGRSAHSVGAAQAAVTAGADYLIVGTVFPSRSHPGGATGGVELVRQVCEAVRVPVIGIGGITSGNAADVVRAGASGVAVISAILGSPDPTGAARELARVIGI